MKIICKETCARIRRKPCAFAGSGYCVGAVEVHHYHARGMGNSSQLDVAFNLCPLCRLHHQYAEDAQINRMDVLDAIADREKIPADTLQRAIYFLVHLDAKITSNRQDALVADLPEAVRVLVQTTLKGIRK